MDILALKTTVANLAQENTKLGNIRRNAPDPEKQPLAIPRTPKSILQLGQHYHQHQRRVRTPLATAVFEWNLPMKVEKGNAMPMNINNSDAEPRKLDKALQVISPPPS
jgi:hypothetical protein